MMRGWWRKLSVWLVPKRCAACGKVVAVNQQVCKRCDQDMPIIRSPICMRCGHEKKLCTCKQRRSFYDRLTAPFYYEDAARRAVLRLKNQADPDAVIWCADEMVRVIRRALDVELISGIVYVPVRETDIVLRDWNPSYLLAQIVAQRLELPLYDALQKRYDTPPQKELKLQYRTGNVFGVFDVIDRRVYGKRLLLVDDVCTTGATLNECAKMLKIYGAVDVSAVTLAIRKRRKLT